MILYSGFKVSLNLETLMDSQYYWMPVWDWNLHLLIKDPFMETTMLLTIIFYNILYYLVKLIMPLLPTAPMQHHSISQFHSSWVKEFNLGFIHKTILVAFPNNTWQSFIAAFCSSFSRSASIAQPFQTAWFHSGI